MSGFAAAKPPRAPSAASAARPPSGAPRLPRRVRAGRVNATTLQPFPEPYPDGGIYWPSKPRTEWVVYFILTKKLGAKLGEDFLYQQIIPAKGINISGKGYRSDFWLLRRGKFGSPGPPYNRGILIDPISTYTHRTTGEDRYRRGALAQAGYLLIWIDDQQLYLNPLRMVRDATRGIDHSSIARSAR